MLGHDLSHLQIKQKINETCGFFFSHTKYNKAGKKCDSPTKHMHTASQKNP
jgi:hypothetical protein